MALLAAGACKLLDMYTVKLLQISTVAVEQARLCSARVLCRDQSYCCSAACAVMRLFRPVAADCDMTCPHKTDVNTFGMCAVTRGSVHDLLSFLFARTQNGEPFGTCAVDELQGPLRGHAAFRPAEQLGGGMSRCMNTACTYLPSMLEYCKPGSNRKCVTH